MFVGAPSFGGVPWQMMVWADPLREQVATYARLSDGRCHYRIDASSTGRPLLLIHGATMGCWQFDRVVPHLAAAGLRAIRLDLYGHGYSDRPIISCSRIRMKSRQMCSGSWCMDSGT